VTNWTGLNKFVGLRSNSNISNWTVW